jgi:ribosome-binding factor A
MAPRGRGKRSASDRRVAGGTTRQYPRAARVNEVLREILAEAIERIADSDDRLALLTVTGVTSDPDQDHATVMFASLSDDARAGLEDHRLRLQALIARQVRLRRTPKLTFVVDAAVAAGARVEEILRHIQASEEGEPD